MGTVVVKIDLDKTRFSAGITDTRKQAKQLADSLKAAGAEGSTAIAGAQKSAEQLGKSLETAGAHGVRGTAAASAAIRVLEGNLTNNIRAAERFVSTFKPVAGLLEAAFPLVGAIAFAGVVGEVSERITKFITTTRDMSRTITAGFENLTLSARTANDELNVSNDKIENEIAKLERKPENNLKLALDEAKVSADQFAKSVETAATAMRELIEKNSISQLQGFFIDTAPTKALAGTIKPFEDDKEHFATQAAIGKSLGDNSRYEKNMKAFHDKEDAELEKMRKVLADAQIKQAAIAGGGLGGITKVDQDQTPIMTMAQGVIDQIQLSRAREGSVGTKEKDDAQLARDQKAAQMTADAKKAQEQLLKQDEEGLKAQNAFNKMSINEEIQFWNAKLAAFKDGSDQYIQVTDKISDLIARRPSLFSVNKINQANAGKSQVEGSDLLSRGAEELAKPQVEAFRKMQEAAEKYRQVAAQAEEIQRKNATAFAEASISIGLAQGSISKLEAAQALAAVHAKDHADALALVNKQLQEQIRLINDPSSKMTPEEQSAARVRATQASANQTAALNGSYAVQQAQDQANVSGNTISGAATQSLREMVQSFSDLAANLKQIIPRMVEGLNDDIVRLATGQGRKGDFGRTLLGAGQGALKAGLQKAEGMGLSFLTHGALGPKRDGSSPQTALYVIQAQAAASVAGMQTSSAGVSAMAGLADLIPGGSFIRPFISSLIPHAGGGDVLAGRGYLVGERGPEPFFPNVSGTMLPNSSLGGGDVHNHFHIDARGATDPSAVNAAVMRAAPHIVTAANHTAHQRQMRTPHGR